MEVRLCRRPAFCPGTPHFSGPIILWPHGVMKPMSLALRRRSTCGVREAPTSASKVGLRESAGSLGSAPTIDLLLAGSCNNGALTLLPIRGCDDGSAAQQLPSLSFPQGDDVSAVVCHNGQGGECTLSSTCEQSSVTDPA